MSSRQWRKLSDALSATHEVVAPDFLGHMGPLMRTAAVNEAIAAQIAAAS